MTAIPPDEPAGVRTSQAVYNPDFVVQRVVPLESDDRAVAGQGYACITFGAFDMEVAFALLPDQARYLASLLTELADRIERGD